MFGGGREANSRPNLQKITSRIAYYRATIVEVTLPLAHREVLTLLVAQNITLLLGITPAKWIRMSCLSLHIILLLFTGPFLYFDYNMSLYDFLCVYPACVLSSLLKIC